MRASHKEAAIAIGKAIDARCKELKLTRAAIAARSGLSRSTITRIAQGVFVPTPNSLMAIADAIEVPHEELFNLAGWRDSLAAASRRQGPHAQITYHNIPREIAQEIDIAINEVAARHNLCRRPNCAKPECHH
ncbi:helix-turn-helix transcriptional regulator [Nocardia sp. NPDC050697]|uniref:helix-turn-helix domain-containing protein n=1 Tax=Nocardia sp. NPDC050697 TaxID=3155158 RepID=UPI0033EFE26C